MIGDCFTEIFDSFKSFQWFNSSAVSIRRIGLELFELLERSEQFFYFCLDSQMF